MEPYIPFILIPTIGYFVYRDLKRKGRLTCLKKWTLSSGLIAFLITETGRSFYRPYIYSHNLHDFAIADTIGNTFGTVTAIFMILTLAGKDKHSDLWLIGMVVGGLLLYELIGPAINHAIDPLDILATLIFGPICLGFYVWLIRNEKR